MLEWNNRAAEARNPTEDGMTATIAADTQARNDAEMTAALERAEGHRAAVRLVGDEDKVEGKVKQASDGKDGERRFQVGRKIVSVSLVTQVEDLEVPNPAEAAANGAGAEAKAAGGTQRDADKAADAVRREAAPQTTLTSGAVVTGKTVTIRCAWVDPDNRTAAQQKLFASGFLGVEKGKGYEAMVKAAGKDKEGHMPDGTERTIKVQDAFQVWFSPENQKRHRNEQRRRKAQARRAERKAAKAAQS